MIDYHDGLVAISVPYRNGTASIDITKYQKRVLNAEKTVNDTGNPMGINIWSEVMSVKGPKTNGMLF